MPINFLKNFKDVCEKFEVFISENETMELEIFNNSENDNIFLIIGEDGQRAELSYYTFMRLKITLKPTIGPLYESLAADLTESGETELASLEAHLDNLNLIKKNETFYAPFSGLIQSSGFGKSKLCLDLIQKRPGIYLVFRNQGETGIPGMPGWMRAFTDFVLEPPTDELPLDLNIGKAKDSTPGKFLLGLKIILDSYFEMIKTECELIKLMDRVKIIILLNLIYCLFID